MANRSRLLVTGGAGFIGRVTIGQVTIGRVTIGQVKRA
jgi:nucleoside-diphosphate-sugar epimerase